MMAWTARWSSIILTSGMAWATAPVAGTVATANELAPIAGDWLPGRIDGGDIYAEPGGAPSRALRKNTSHDCQRTQITLSNFTQNDRNIRPTVISKSWHLCRGNKITETRQQQQIMFVAIWRHFKFPFEGVQTVTSCYCVQSHGKLFHTADPPKIKVHWLY